MSNKKVKVRVLVVVDSEGNWAALGHRDANDWEDLICVADGLNGGLETQVWITADVPLPGPLPDIPADVESAVTRDPEAQ